LNVETLETPKIPLGISSCLIGERVRFDGGHKQNRYILDTLGEYFCYRSSSPEMAIGLSVPRQTIRLVDINGDTNAVGVKDSDLNVTNALVESAHQQREWHQDIFGYIVKKGSPSCGMERVKVYKNGIPFPKPDSSGIYTQTLMQNFPNLPVEEEGRLGDPLLRENFIQRVFVFKRWRELFESGISWAQLTDFHARHKYIFYSHNQNLGRALGKELSQKITETAEAYAEIYLPKMMQILKITVKRSNHVNVLEHIRGYIKNELKKDDKKELSDCIENYRLGWLPLIVPITLLKHHFMKFPNTYIERSHYLEPHPHQLMLLNQL